jgi:hypothetical protein
MARAHACSFPWAAAIVVVLLGVIPSVAAAQVLIDPTAAEFSASPDHDASASGIPVVSSYQLELYLPLAPTPFLTVPLGKPSPDANGVIRVSLASLLVPLPAPGITYTATVAALGPGGVGRSAPSNPFTWSGTPTCTYSITPVSQASPQGGGTFNVAVTAGNGCTWTATESLGWVSITAGSSGSGNGSVTYSVASNSGASSRSGSLTIAGRSMTVTQAGTGCSYSVTPTSQAMPAAAGSATAAVTAAAGCAWTATEALGWIAITSGASGSGNGTVAYTVTANGSTSSRSGAMTIAGRTLTVTQSGAAPCAYSITPVSQSFGDSGGTATVAVTTTAGCAWTASDNRSWIVITSGSSGTGAGTVRYSVSPNTATTDRSGTLTIAGRTVAIAQTAPPAAPPAPGNLRIVLP